MTAVADLPAADVSPTLVYTWESQCRQHAVKGRPGIAYTRNDAVPVGTAHHTTGDVQIVASVEALLYRNQKGRLVGILYHYPQDITYRGKLLEAAGNVNLYVRPDRRRRGIASALLADAARRWPIDWEQQRYTPAGRATVAAFLAGEVPG